MTELKEKKCVPCEGGIQPFNSDEILKYKKQLSDDWNVIENKKLRKVFLFENFKRGMAYAQEIAYIAEKENHHPVICIHYTHVDVILSTHAIDGLSENDFIMADKIDNI